MLRIVLLEIKDAIIKNTKIVLLSAFAFLLSCIAVNIALTNFVAAYQQQAVMEKTYGKKSYFKINLNGGEEVFRNFFGGDYAEQIKNAFEQLNAEESFDYRYPVENGIEFFSIEDPTYGADYFPSYPQECVDGYEQGVPLVYEDYLRLKGVYADRLFKSEANVRLSEGEWFKEENYYIQSLEDIHLPVILGSAYKGCYKIGDTLTNAHIATEESITLEVIGFLEENSFYYDNNNDKILLNRYMLVPCVEVSYDYMTETGDTDSFFRAAYSSEKIMNARIICKEDDRESVVSRVNQIFMENQLYELRLVDESSGAKKELEESKDLAWSGFLICMFIILFSTIVYGIQMYYKILQNRRKYSVYLLNGITKKQIFLLTLTDTLLVFLLADLLFEIFRILNTGRGMEGLGLTGGWTIVVILFMELLILVMMGFLGIRRMQRLDMSSVLRENE